MTLLASLSLLILVYCALKSSTMTYFLAGLVIGYFLGRVTEFTLKAIRDLKDLE